LWISNIAILEVGGVLMKFMSRLRWGPGRILGGARGSFLATLDLRWGMTPKFDYGMMFSVGIKLSRTYFFGLV
jgi:hypothetical protein